ncbi:hypothetical protein PHPALM_30526 [Phytophthora palmivora]|uniref:Uncharacterized protein n=1 Tax=Phytophthora palmivora TaxID=4796 RepID=A0A2P4X4Y0_9STRA|nr:hypothetical protein PHPALM_30526 [Phytophthora palmivora]
MARNTPQYKADSDTVIHSVSQPVFYHDGLAKRRRAQDQYEETIRQRCFESHERIEDAMEPVKSSIDWKLLGLYELRKTVENISSEELLTLIK